MWGAFVTAIGMDDGKGHLSFNKSVTALAMATFVFSVVTRRDPTWTLLSFGIVVIGAGFGLKGYMGAIKQNTMRGESSVVKRTEITVDAAKVIAAIKAQRDHDRGIDPA